MTVGKSFKLYGMTYKGMQPPLPLVRADKKFFEKFFKMSLLPTVKPYGMM